MADAPATGYIVMLQAGSDAQAVATAQAKAAGATIGHVYQYAIRGYSARMSPAASRSTRSCTERNGRIAARRSR